VAVGLSQGVRLGPYQIVAPLGAGGMGAVYKATDTRLGRTVAIKVVADCGSNDPQRQRRFEQEARAVSALSHPNICVLYDVGCETPAGGHPSAEDPPTPSGPLQFLVMEYLEGETLSKRLRGDGVSFDEALEIGAQVADALAVAHRHGIIHRDLKPGNIMLTRSGSGIHARLLDFGLAKLRPTPTSDLESTHSKHEPDTRPGAVLGTLPYMAPEQLEGKATDARSDIFALGCVLYEMLTGRRAFRGDSEASVISAIMGHEPEPLATLQPATPAALDHLVRRCLQKDLEHRSESAHDLAEELRWLREAYRTTRNSDGHPWRRATDPVSGFGERPAVVTTPPAPRRGRRVALAFSLVAVAVVSYAVTAYLRGWWPWSGDPFRNAVLLQVTAEEGLQAEPALSPDGTLIAYVSVPQDGGTAHIWLTEANGTARTPLTSGPEPGHDPAWSHDGSAVLFTRHGGARRGIWKVPRLGGNATKVVDNAAQPAVSPDGSRLAFVREVSPSGETRVHVAPLKDVSQARRVTSGQDGLWDHTHPSWSPDGHWLCYAAQHALWKVSVDRGGATRLTSDNESATDPVWSEDGRWVYFTSTREGTTALWKVAANGGTPRRVRSASGSERQPSISGNGERLAFSTDAANLDVVLQTISTGAQQTLAGTAVQELMPRFSPDGQAVVFVSGQTTSRNDLWVQPLDGGRASGQPRPLTNHQEGEVDHPAVSADGRWVAYYHVVNGKRDIWVVPLSGGPSERITTDPASDIEPAWSHDGKQLAFASDRGGGFHIRTVPIADGRAAGREVQVTPSGAYAIAPEWSPTDEWIAYVGGPTTADAEVWVTGADGSGRPQRVTTKAGAFRARWPQKDQMVVGGRWGESTLSLRLVAVATGAPTHLVRPVVLGDNPSDCDFDIDLDSGLVVFAARTSQGTIWTLTKRR
jgi:Tol biopolymer transport system component/serine/threonine protein kinase